MTPILLALLLSAACLYWWQAAVDCRELANRAAFAACGEAGLTLLDGTVAFRGYQVGRDRSGRLKLRRTYTFDYSPDGVSRAQGFVLLIGRELESVGLGAATVTARS